MGNHALALTADLRNLGVKLTKSSLLIICHQVNGIIISGRIVSSVMSQFHFSVSIFH